MVSLQIRKRRIPLMGIAVPAFIFIAWFFLPSAGAEADDELTVKVRRDTFRSIVTTAGELRAKSHVEIKGPPDAQAAQLYTLKIASIVPEGTIVSEGDVVAEIDRAPIATKLSEVGLAMTKATAMMEQAQLDTTLNLAMARENSRNLRMALEEKSIAKDQAKYEPPGVRRQADIEYEKASRSLLQDSANYETKVKQAQAKMREVSIDVTRQENLMTKVQGVADQFTIRAPANGMIIYYREYNGKKRGVGSQVSSYDPIIATLPDLTLMQSLTYVNELDVRKLAIGQPVTVSLDADPGKKLKGRVTEVANMGEQRPNVDAKVFEVVITMEESDTSLRPGMTSSNAIEAQVIPDALLIPLEAVVSEGQVPYVYKKSGGRLFRQEIRTGALNDSEIVVLMGLAEGDEILLSRPASADGIETVNLPAVPGEPADTARAQQLPPSQSQPPPSGAPSGPTGVSTPGSG